MSKASSIAFLVFAILTSLFIIVGGLFLLLTLTSTPIRELNDADAPYTSYFFVLFSLVNAAFLVGLGVVAVRLFKNIPSGWSLLTWILKAELVYFLFISSLWLLPKPWGMSAAGATGIGNMGISPQFFIAYPITGVLAIWILRKCNVLTVEPTEA
jgi:hypothetical protein